MYSKYLKKEAIMINTALVQVRVDEALKDEVTRCTNERI